HATSRKSLSVASVLRQSQFARRLTRPPPTGGSEGTLVGITEEKCDVGQAEVPLLQILAGKIMPQAIHKVCEGGTEFAKPAHHGALTHAKLSGNDLGSCLAMRNELNQSPFHPVDEFGLPLWPMAKNFLGVIV